MKQVVFLFSHGLGRVGNCAERLAPASYTTRFDLTIRGGVGYKAFTCLETTFTATLDIGITTTSVAGRRTCFLR